ncbi:unnamed protein product [Closterium sp. Yama58-4]|nr:unnamed protein product [Closterium sp. Yama58-4]
MLEAAKWVAQSQGQLIAHLLSQNPDYSLVTVGHSLGAGTAALLAMLLRHPPSLPALSLSPHHLPPAALIPYCWAFACPCIVSQDLAETAFFIRSVVLQMRGSGMLMGRRDAALCMHGTDRALHAAFGAT